ncbi:polyadenylation and cleavage factor4 [Dorcoceras hygrometricum]|uniref:Polyadenylation and cleavage factor4 n=1 Tax=Dorcoceras hygrometricum TaxID=472368 RepID=A0A2Z7D4T9_9LAMI|nr:polyadenylation and cleavage factor4 [Dorcoceras hygrometricum]
MDNISRFQNHIPISNGSFNKLPPNRNDAFGMKPQPQIILDRFRAMVRDREEELGLFGSHVEEAVSLLSMDEIVRFYEIVLSELTFNSKPTITDLTMIAGEQMAHAKGIAEAICSRIIEVFCEAYAQVHPNMHPAMRHLFGTWSSVFPVSVLRKIEERLQFSPSVSGRSPRLNSSRASESPRPMRGIHVNPKYLEARRQFGHSAVDSVPADQKLPSLYLLDSIVKNIGKEYIKSRLNSSRASESPRPMRGIHVNPKYLEARRQFGHSAVDSGGVEGASSAGVANRATSSFDAIKKSVPSAAKMMQSSTYRTGHTGSLVPSLDESSVDNSPRRVAVGASPSKVGISYGLSRMISREEENSEWQLRNLQGKSNHHLKTTAAYYNNDVDLRGPRALISAYGIDEREKNLTSKRQTIEQLDTNVIDSKGAVRAWQNTEEEEFDWKDMTSSNSVTPFGHGAINRTVGDLSNVADPTDLIGVILPPSLPSQHSQSRLNANGPGSFLENRSHFTSSDKRSPNLGDFPTSDGISGGSTIVVSKLSSNHDSPAPELRPDPTAALFNSQYPAKLSSSHILTPVSALPPQLQSRGQFGMNQAGNIIVYHGLNKTAHSGTHLSGITNISHFNMPPVPSQSPGLVPFNLQRHATVSSLQPNFLLPQEFRPNLPMPSTGSAPSQAKVPPPNYGYLQGHGPAMSLASSNLVPGGHPPLPTSFNMPGPALPSLLGGPRPGITPAMLSQNIGRVAPNSGAVPLSSLFSSLVAQGLISLTKQDSIGVDFDPDSLKIRHESAITALYGDLPRQCTTCGLRFKSQEEHSKHMDWHVSKNRTLKTRKTKPSPKWFVSVSMWLHGAEALGTEAVPGFLPPENTVEKEANEEMAVPADEDQNACALCGERFDDFYSDELEEWMYKGAVYMYAPAGSTEGIDRSQLGPIVHVKCKSDSHGMPPEDFTRVERELAEEGGPKKKQRS